jgi:PhzF family phenazine biosynthesis protein
MPTPLFVVDAFAEHPFSGNPAAVCLLERERDATWMQLVAREMNLSETAFVAPAGDGELALRWFTPAVEIDLCGHATLASAHVLYETGRLDRWRKPKFHTKSGVLTASLDDRGLWLDFPARRAEEAPPPDGLAEALGAKPAWTARFRDDVVALFESDDEVRRLAPDFGRLLSLDARAVIVTARSSRPEHDFVSRFFGPRVGVPEDPVTGSAHCVLTPLWAERLMKTTMTAYQASPRGGLLQLRLEGDRVHLGGRAFTITRGELAV